MDHVDITKIDELIEFMDAEAAEWGRDKSEQKTVNGAGIQQQWEERDKFPYPVFYLIYNTLEDAEDTFLLPDGTPAERRAQFDLKAMWFDENGNVTDRPCGNETPLYRDE